MTAIVILTVLVMIAIPNFINRVDKAKEAQVLANIRTLQTMLETYRTDNQAYPDNLAQLAAAANQKGYNKEVANPMSGQRGKIGNPNLWAIEFVDPGPAGYVGYEVVNPTEYRLYGYSKDGTPIKRDGKIYRISNG